MMPIFTVFYQTRAGAKGAVDIAAADPDEAREKAKKAVPDIHLYLKTKAR